MRYKITSTRYDEFGKPISVQHSTIADTEKDKCYKGIDTNEALRGRFESFWNTPQKDGSLIRVDSVERVTS